MDALIVWARQPTSVAGLAILFGTLSALMTGQLSWGQAFPLLAGALASIALPDNTRAKSDAEALARGMVTGEKPNAGFPLLGTGGTGGDVPSAADPPSRI